MKKVALSQVKDDLSRYLRRAAKEDVVITRHGRAAGVLIGFESEDDWFDYRLENDPRFTKRIAAARASLRAGRGVELTRFRGHPRVGAERSVHDAEEPSTVPARVSGAAR